MKKKWIIGITIAVLVAAAIAVVAILLITSLPGNKQQEEPEQSVSVSFVEDCWNRVTDCKIEEQTDGTVAVVLTAPDYVQLINLLAAETANVTEEAIVQAAKNNPQAVKEYAFVAKTAKDEDVRAALMDQIAYELIALTLVDVHG